jgi:hypothetical protein
VEWRRGRCQCRVGRPRWAGTNSQLHFTSLQAVSSLFANEQCHERLAVGLRRRVYVEGGIASTDEVANDERVRARRGANQLRPHVRKLDAQHREARARVDEPLVPLVSTMQIRTRTRTRTRTRIVDATSTFARRRTRRGWVRRLRRRCVRRRRSVDRRFVCMGEFSTLGVVRSRRHPKGSGVARRFSTQR